MISICIPIYNCCVSELVSDLKKQADIVNIPYQILLIDDFSENDYREKK
ncbi:MAG: hypothetical protein ACLVKO_03265 [Dysgonomonas sp.]